ncbi:MAG TPA: hypothetical protein VJK50_02830 [Patescibacteria group bacterium]|nr:hypothetical protein [Patescibacteria group bacterium]
MRKFRILIYQAIPGYWIGVCLDVDYAAQANTAEHAAQYTIEGTAILIQGNPPGSRDGMEAPSYFTEEYETVGAISEEYRTGKVAGEECEFVIRKAHTNWQPLEAA